MFWYFISDHHVIFASKQQWTRDQHEPTITTIMGKTLLCGTWQLCIATHTLSFPNGTIHFGEIVGEANKSQLIYVPASQQVFLLWKTTNQRYLGILYYILYIYTIYIHFFPFLFLAFCPQNYQNSSNPENPKQTSPKSPLIALDPWIFQQHSCTRSMQRTLLEALQQKSIQLLWLLTSWHEISKPILWIYVIVPLHFCFFSLKRWVKDISKN